MSSRDPFVPLPKTNTRTGDNTGMVYGDAQKVAANLLAGVKTL